MIESDADECAILGQRMPALGRDLPDAEHLSAIAANVSEGGIAVTSKRRTYTTHYWASDSNSAFASAICGNSGVGEKPSSAGLRTSQASAGRPVD